MPNGMVNAKVTYTSLRGFPDNSTLADMLKLYKQLFDDADKSFFIQRLKDQSESLSILVHHKNSLIAFKVGYPYTNTIFYSWIGGVLKAYRNQGIATYLAQLQEDYARENGFNKIRTKSMNKFKPMMRLNLKNGYDITQVYTNALGQTKIVFEKSIY